MTCDFCLRKIPGEGDGSTPSFVDGFIGETSLNLR